MRRKVHMMNFGEEGRVIQTFEAETRVTNTGNSQSGFDLKGVTGFWNNQ